MGPSPRPSSEAGPSHWLSSPGPVANETEGSSGHPKHRVHPQVLYKTEERFRRCVGVTVRYSRDLPLLLPPRGPWLRTGNRLFGFPGRPCPTLHVPAVVALLTGAQLGTR